jgi:hypothetical protein
MKYHAPTKQFTISVQNLEQASRALKWAIKHIRLGGGHDTKGYEYSVPMDNAEFAEAGILDAAKDLGIDLGADRPGRLDVSNEG